jgi:hypothetical protein
MRLLFIVLLISSCSNGGLLFASEKSKEIETPIVKKTLQQQEDEKYNEIRLGLAIPLYELINDENTGSSYVNINLEYGRRFHDFIFAFKYQGASYSKQVGCCGGEYNSPFALTLTSDREMLVVLKYRFQVDFLSNKRGIRELRPILEYGKGRGIVKEELTSTTANEVKLSYEILRVGVEFYFKPNERLFYSFTLSTTKINYSHPDIRPTGRDHRLSFNIPSPEANIGWLF